MGESKTKHDAGCCTKCAPFCIRDLHFFALFNERLERWTTTTTKSIKMVAYMGRGTQRREFYVQNDEVKFWQWYLRKTLRTSPHSRDCWKLKHEASLPRHYSICSQSHKTSRLAVSGRYLFPKKGRKTFAQDHQVSYGPRRHMPTPIWVFGSFHSSQRFHGTMNAVGIASRSSPKKYWSCSLAFWRILIKLRNTPGDIWILQKA